MVKKKNLKKKKKRSEVRKEKETVIARNTL